MVSPEIGDYGADQSLFLPKRLLQRIKASGAKVEFKPFESHVRLRAAIKILKSVSFTACGKVVLDIRISLRCGILIFRNVEFWVISQDMDELLLGRPLLKFFGINLYKVIREPCEKRDEIDASLRTVMAINSCDLKLAAIGRYQGIRFEEEETDPVDHVDEAAANMGFETEKEVPKALENILESASDARMSAEGIKRSDEVLKEYRNLFRIKHVNDPPESVEPLEVSVRPRSNPVRSAKRRYDPAQNDLINPTIRFLEEIGAVKRSSGAKLTSTALAVPKTGTNKLRFSVYLRGINWKRYR